MRDHGSQRDAPGQRVQARPGVRRRGLLHGPVPALDREAGPPHRLADGRDPERTGDGDHTVGQEFLVQLAGAVAPAGLGHAQRGEGVTGEGGRAEHVGLTGVLGEIGVLQQEAAAVVAQPRGEDSGPAADAGRRPGGGHLVVRAERDDRLTVDGDRSPGDRLPGDRNDQVGGVDRQQLDSVMRRCVVTWLCRRVSSR